MLFFNKKKKKIAILFLCIGKENDYFNEIHESYEKYFLPKAEKHYFVFTDEIKRYKMVKHVYPFDVPNLPTPLNNLLKINHFLKQIDLYTGYDYIMMADSNYFISSKVDEKDVLPRSILNERYTFMLENSKLGINPEEFPYERNHESTAFVNYNRGKFYISDAFVLGEEAAFLELCKTINENILTDLANNYITPRGLEAHLNKYIVNVIDCRFIEQLKELFEYHEQEEK